MALQDEVDRIFRAFQSEYPGKWWLGKVLAVRVYHAPRPLAARMELVVGRDAGFSTTFKLTTAKAWRDVDSLLWHDGFKLAEAAARFFLKEQDPFQYSNPTRHYTEWRIKERG